mgnify:CR=1 FL=1
MQAGDKQKQKQTFELQVEQVKADPKTNLLLKLIRIYQLMGPYRMTLTKTMLGGSGRGTCRFTPTCSRYTYEATERYGIVKGIILGVKRVARCHPWSVGGFDPLPNN